MRIFPVHSKLSFYVLYKAFIGDLVTKNNVIIFYYISKIQLKQKKLNSIKNIFFFLSLKQTCLFIYFFYYSNWKEGFQKWFQMSQVREKSIVSHLSWVIKPLCFAKGRTPLLAV